MDLGIEVSAKTLGELREVTAWPEDLIITTPSHRGIFPMNSSQRTPLDGEIRDGRHFLAARVYCEDTEKFLRGAAVRLLHARCILGS
jgi:hypothetical protein